MNKMLSVRIVVALIMMAASINSVRFKRDRFFLHSCFKLRFYELCINSPRDTVTKWYLLESQTSNDNNESQQHPFKKTDLPMFETASQTDRDIGTLKRFKEEIELSKKCKCAMSNIMKSIVFLNALLLVLFLMVLIFLLVNTC